MRELANYMEDNYQELLDRGISEPDALKRTVNEVRNWKQFSREIEIAKGGEMTNRVQKVWIPGLICLLVTSLGESSLQHFHVGTPRILENTSWLTLSAPFLVLAVCAGALGGFGSWFAGGNRKQRLLSGTFPAFCSLLLFLGFVPVGFFVELGIRKNTGWGDGFAAAFMASIVFGVVVPAVALLVGTLPTVLLSSRIPRGEPS